jgi:hypothetical protein
MRNCDVPGQPNSPLGPWRTAEMAPNAVMVDACATGGGVGFRFTGLGHIPHGQGAVLALLRPASGPQSQIRLVKAVLWYAARLAGTGPPLNFSSLIIGPGDAFRPGVSNAPPGAENLVLEQVFDPLENHYKVFVVCGPPAGPPATEDCVPADTMPLQIRGMEVTLSEDVQPIVQPPGGTLLEGGPQSGTRTLTYAASDPQSGLAKVEALLDDTVVASQDLAARCFYSEFSVCPTSQDGTLQIDTRAVPNGSHSLALRVQDAAGNQRVVSGASAIEVANPPGPESVLGYALTVRFKGTSRSTITVPYGRRVLLRGRLARGSQRGPAGASLDVLERLSRTGAQERAAGSVQLKPDGTFSYVLAANSPSRVIRLAYRPSGGIPTFSSALRLRVRAASTLRASLAGVVIRFSGRVRSGPIPLRGKRLQMEGRAPGSAWKSFASIRTDRAGRFTGRYRLRIRRPGVRLKIRVVVPREDGYPYVTSRSRAVTLTVR